jgi:predicted outer membrane repeat protein
MKTGTQNSFAFKKAANHGFLSVAHSHTSSKKSFFKHMVAGLKFIAVAVCLGFSAFGLVGETEAMDYNVTDWENFIKSYKNSFLTNGDIIKLKNNISVEDAIEIGAPGGNNFKIDGNKFKLDSGLVENLGFVFTLASQKSITFENIEFTRFKNMPTATDGYGGVIQSADGAFTFLGNIGFTSNSANGSYAYGGAIYIQSSTFSFVNSQVSFTNNSANGPGGSGGSGFGGAIDAYLSSFSFVNSQVSFTSNSVNASVSQGGAIYVESSTFSFVNSQVSFMSNSANGPYASARGGAIYVQSSTFSFVNSQVSFTNNSANGPGGSGGSGFGGAIHAYRFSNFSFVNSQVSFTSNSASSWGGAIYVENSTFSFVNSQITFIDNKANNALNDVSFWNYDDALVFSGNNTLTNGIRASGAASAKIIISKNSILNFHGNSDIANIVINDGNAVFRSGISTITKRMSVSAGAGIYLKNSPVSNGDNTSLTVKTLTLANGSVLSFEIDFEKNLSPILFVNEIILNGVDEKGVSIEISNLTPYAPITDTPITIISADSSFDWTKFSYNTDNYKLFFEDGNLQIINFPFEPPAPPEPNFDYLTLSKNQSEFLDILSGDTHLISSFSKLSESKMKESLDSLSGVFLVNVIDAMSYNDSIVPLSKRLISDDGAWASISFNSMKFDNSDNTLGAFTGTGGNLNVGMDLYNSEPIRAGAFLGLGITNYSQSQNTASVFSTKAGLYGNAVFSGIEARAELGGSFASASAKREAYIAKTYNTDSSFSAYGIGLILDFDYMLNINESQKAGPFAMFAWQTISNSKIEETGGDPINLKIPAQSMSNTEGTIGGEFRHMGHKFNLIGRVFIGLPLSDRKALNIEFLGSEMSIQSDNLQDMFYGGSVSASTDITENIGLSADISMKLNSSYNDVKGGISAVYKLPPARGGK